MGFARFVLRTLAVLVWVCSSVPALAQEPPTPGVSLQGGFVTHTTHRSDALSTTQINAAACSNDDPGVCSPSSVLVAGTEASLVSAQHCGSASKTASSASIAPLTAGVAYNVALTAVDTSENESVLSPVVCEVPRDKVAENEKSSACAFSRRPQTLPVLFVLSLAGLRVARRRHCRITAAVANF